MKEQIMKYQVHKRRWIDNSLKDVVYESDIFEDAQSTHKSKNNEWLDSLPKTPEEISTISKNNEMFFYFYSIYDTERKTYL